MSAPLAATVSLSRGAALPRLGLGTSPIDEVTLEALVPRAVEAGYRLFDTAENYRNEAALGRGLRASGIARTEVFVTTKFNRAWHGRPGVAAALEASLERLGTGYVDLLMIHWPNPDQDRFVEAFEQLVELYEAGTLRAIGTSNFTVAHLERLYAATGSLPDVNQVQCNPYVQQRGLRAYDRANEVVTQSWSPLGAAGAPVLSEPVIASIADRHGATTSQVVLAWHLRSGLVAVPKTENPQRLVENLAALELELEASELEAIDSLDRGEQAGIDPDQFGH